MLIRFLAVTYIVSERNLRRRTMRSESASA